MSKLERLIQQYCPDGVEWKMFYDVCDFIRGITYNKSQEAKTETEDIHKVLRANNITLYLNVLNFEDVKLVSKDVVVKPEQHLYAGDILMCAGSGSKEHVGKVAFISENIEAASWQLLDAKRVFFQDICSISFPVTIFPAT